MINLLPPNVQKQVQIEYWIRVCSVWLILLGLACIVLGLLLVPSLFLVHSQLAVFDGTYQNANTQNNAYEDLEQDVRISNGIAAQLVSSNNETLFFDFISEIERIAERTVTLNSIEFSRNEAVIESIQISGDASSRSSLVQFRDDLEDSPLFASAELPLSDLAKDKDVPFGIVIVISNELQE